MGKLRYIYTCKQETRGYTMIRLYAFELEFTCNGERMTRTMVASSEDNARHDLLNSYPVDGGIYLIAKKPA